LILVFPNLLKMSSVKKTQFIQVGESRKTKDEQFERFENIQNVYNAS